MCPHADMGQMKRYGMRRTAKYLAAVMFGLSLPTTAYAMHIGDGILPFNWAALWYVVAIPFVGLGLYKLNKDKNV